MQVKSVLSVQVKLTHVYKVVNWFNPKRKKHKQSKYREKQR